MVKLRIVWINNYKYVLCDDDNVTYHVSIDFYGLDNRLSINDFVYMDEDLLANINNQVVSFGPIEDISGRKIFSSKDKDLIYLKTKDNEIVLKRLYG